MNLQKAKVINNKALTYNVFELQLKVDETFNFQAGQFITIKINDNQEPICFRAYSISSSPEFDHLEICIKVIKNGRGSNWLNKLKPNDELDFIGPSGNFTFKSKKEKSTIFIATGTGIAPLKSIIGDQLTKDNNQKIQLIFGVRHIKDIFYLDHFKKLQKKYQNFNFELTLSQPEDDNWKGHKGRVTSLLEKMEIDPSTDFYICGLNAMIDSVTKILREKGIPDESIHAEKYD